jgi:hypothetical protein
LGATRNVALKEESPQPHRRRTGIVMVNVGGHSRPISLTPNLEKIRRSLGIKLVIFITAIILLGAHFQAKASRESQQVLGVQKDFVLQEVWHRRSSCP